MSTTRLAFQLTVHASKQCQRFVHRVIEQSAVERKRKAKALAKLPRLKSNSQAERFVADSDLTQFDLSALTSVQFEFAPKVARINMRLPVELLTALKRVARRRGVRISASVARLLNWRSRTPGHRQVPLRTFHQVRCVSLPRPPNLRDALALLRSRCKSTLTIRLPDTKYQRLKAFARTRGVSLNKIIEEWATVLD